MRMVGKIHEHFDGIVCKSMNIPLGWDREEKRLRETEASSLDQFCFYED
jgi:hypothetical protein